MTSDVIEILESNCTTQNSGVKTMPFLNSLFSFNYETPYRQNLFCSDNKLLAVAVVFESQFELSFLGNSTK